MECQCECKYPVKHWCKEDYVWNHRICDYDTDEYLKKYAYIKIFTNDLVITCD